MESIPGYDAWRTAAPADACDPERCADCECREHCNDAGDPLGFDMVGFSYAEEAERRATADTE